MRSDTARWRGTPRNSAAGIIKDVCNYFFLIREYCARFVAGVLSSPDLSGRFKRAPGRDMSGWNDQDPLSIGIALTGNGWRFLPLAGFDNQLSHDRVEDSLRDSIRGRIGEYLQQTPPGSVSLSELLDLRKLITAQGMLSVDFKGRESGSIEVAPNGCSDTVKQTQRHWGSFVGPGETSYDLPPRQVVRRIDPGLAGGSDGWFLLCPAARDAANLFRNATWFEPAEREWNALTERQGGLGARDRSTIRALWETLIRGKLELSDVL